MSESDPLDTLLQALARTPVVAPDSLIGRTIDGRYRIDRRIGQGGFGTVYQAFHLALDAPVALKVVRVSLETPAEHRAEKLARFMQEGRMLPRLRHPHIVAALDLGVVEVDGHRTPYLVMEWCGGLTLQHTIASGPVPFPAAWMLVEPIVDAIAFAHTLGIVHRDLTPNNIMIENAGDRLVPRVIDFGIAKLADADDAPLSDRTRSEIAFTPAYAAPEQVAGLRSGPWTDVHALGLLFVALVIGESPLERLRRAQRVGSLDTTRPTPRAFDVDVGAFEPVLARALALHPADRPRDAVELLRELQTAASSMALQSTMVSLPEPPQSVPSHKDRNLVGRDREWTQLIAACQRVAAGSGELFLLGGEAGIGKTRLADAVAARAHATGFEVAWGRCWEAGGAPAYWPWIHALRALGEELPAATDAPTDPTQSRFQLFNAVGDLLRRRSIARPLLLILDDLHAADVASLLLLEFVVRDLRNQRVLVLGMYRDHDARVAPETGPLIARIGREGTSVLLRRLDRAEVIALVRASKHEFADRTLAEIFRVTEGNPLFVSEVVHLLSVVSNASSGVPIPENVRETIRSRLSLLQGDARELLAIAAVAGRDSCRAVVATAAGVDPARLDERLRSAVESNVIEIAGDRLRFSHVLLRDVLYGELATERRARLHLAIADALAQLDGDLAEIAHHRIESAGVAGVDAAAVAALAAAEKARAVMALEDAARLLDRTLGLLAAHPGSERRRVEVLVALGLARIQAGDVGIGMQACRRGAELARAIGDHELLARAALARGTEYHPGFTDPELVALLEEALVALPPGDSALRAQLMGRLAAALQPAEDPTEPVRMARDAVSMARRIAEPHTLRSVLHAAAAALAFFAEPSERALLSEEIVTLAHAAGDKVEEIRARLRLVFDWLQVGDLVRADTHLAAHGALVEEVRQTRHRCENLLLRGMRALFEQRFADLETCHAETLEFPEATANPTLHYSILMQRLCRALSEERLDDAEAAIPEILFIAERAPHRSFVPYSYLARIRVRRGDIEGARALLPTLLSSRLVGFPQGRAAIAEVIAVAGDEASRERFYSALLPYAKHLTQPGGVPSMVLEEPIAQRLGTLAASLGRIDDAIRHFDASIAQLEHLRGRAYLQRARREREKLVVA